MRTRLGPRTPVELTQRGVTSRATMTNASMAVHIINFLAIVGSVPHLYANFTEGDFKQARVWRRAAVPSLVQKARGEVIVARNVVGAVPSSARQVALHRLPVVPRPQARRPPETRQVHHPTAPPGERRTGQHRRTSRSASIGERGSPTDQLDAERHCHEPRRPPPERPARGLHGENMNRGQRRRHHSRAPQDRMGRGHGPSRVRPDAHIGSDRKRADGGTGGG